jgi:putative transposase
MMIDADVVYVSPGTVYNVLKKAGLIIDSDRKPSKKGTGFVQPLKPHEHWHIDVTYINLGGTFYYLCAILDGYSRYIVHWELRESMKEKEIEIIIERAREKFPGKTPRIISDNGPQFIAKEFATYIRLCCMTHVRTSPYYPESNGKLERWNGELKRECIRPKAPTTKNEAISVVTHYVSYYNDVRLHSAVGYVAPKDKLAGKAEIIQAERDRKLEAAQITRRRTFEKKEAGIDLQDQHSL